MTDKLSDVTKIQTLYNIEDVNSWLDTKEWIIIDIYHVCPNCEYDPSQKPVFVLGKIN